MTTTTQTQKGGNPTAAIVEKIERLQEQTGRAWRYKVDNFTENERKKIKQIQVKLDRRILGSAFK